ncbi:ferritin-like domain-containing protein [Chryseolinea sp. T2]|uniref:ferritin-like domain-containing protein n=1 Tax=Chryseolinea sp. T2 TaxID=3129255 RepID=UPI003076AA0A
MNKTQSKSHDSISDFEKRIMSPMRRGRFLKYLGASTAVSAIIVSGCDDDDDAPSMNASAVDLGSGDIGILNYAYLLEQLEAAFYEMAVSTPYSGISAAETSILTDIRDHEKAHRDFFKAALGSSAITTVEFDFSSIDFNSRASVLGTAKVFEDLGVSAYNGAGKLLVKGEYLLLAGKIVSVEARHASAIRDLLNPFTADYAGDDVIAVANGLDLAKSPAEVLSAAGSFVKNTVNFDKLPS